MKKLLCLGENGQYNASFEEQIKLIHQVGFDATFIGWSKSSDLKSLVQIVRNEGLILQSVHAPFNHMADIWGDDDSKAKEAIDELIACLNDCIMNDVPIMVLHAYIGFNTPEPNQIGIERLKKLVDVAEGSNVKLAFENTEGIEYLDAIMEAFKDSPSVGFCLDSGHELCYNYGIDQLAKYGSRLLCTHLNDNLGISDKDGKIWWTDDLHLLPFDGIADWQGIADRLVKHGYDGILTFELNTKSKPDRHENDKYDEMPLEEYLKEAYIRAKKISLMTDI